MCMCVCVVNRAFKLINLTYTANYANYIEEVKLKHSCYTLWLPQVASGRGKNKFLCVCAKREKIHSALISKKQTRSKKIMQRKKESFETNRQCGPWRDLACFGHGFPRGALGTCCGCALACAPLLLSCCLPCCLCCCSSAFAAACCQFVIGSRKKQKLIV